MVDYTSNSEILDVLSDTSVSSYFTSKAPKGGSDRFFGFVDVSDVADFRVFWADGVILRPLFKSFGLRRKWRILISCGESESRHGSDALCGKPTICPVRGFAHRILGPFLALQCSGMRRNPRTLQSLEGS